MTVDDATIAAAADLVSLIAVCTFTAHRMAEGDEDAAELAGHLARSLDWCRSLSIQTHDDLTGLQRVAEARRKDAREHREAESYPQPLRA